MDIADILIHVHPDLPVDDRAGLEEGLRGFEGVISVHFNPHTPICWWSRMTPS